VGPQVAWEEPRQSCQVKCFWNNNVIYFLFAVGERVKVCKKLRRCWLKDDKRNHFFSIISQATLFRYHGEEKEQQSESEEELTFEEKEESFSFCTAGEPGKRCSCPSCVRDREKRKRKRQPSPTESGSDSDPDDPPEFDDRRAIVADLINKGRLDRGPDKRDRGNPADQARLARTTQLRLKIAGQINGEIVERRSSGKKDVKRWQANEPGFRVQLLRVFERNGKTVVMSASVTDIEVNKQKQLLLWSCVFSTDRPLWISSGDLQLACYPWYAAWL